MHIVLLTDEVLPDARGGVAVVVEELRQEFVRQGHTVTLVSTHNDDEKPNLLKEETKRGEVIRVRAKRNHAQPFRHSVTKTKVTEMIGEILEDLQPDVVHAHNVHEILGYHVLDEARKVTDKVFITVHDTFMVSFARVGGEKYRHAIVSKQPYKLHWWDGALKVGRRYWPLRNGITKKILKRSVTNVLTYTDAMESFLRANGIPKLKRVKTGIGNGPNVTEAEVQKFRSNYQIDGPSVLFGARLSGDKGVDVFLEAAEEVIKAIPNAVFLIIGDQDRWKPYESRLSENLKKQIRPIAWLPHNELQIGYHAVDVVTVPSIYLDNFPTVNLEAMRAGKPVVGTCFGGTPEAVQDGKTGYIVDPTNIQEFSGKLAELLKSEELQTKMGEAGKKRVAEQFSTEGAAKDLLSLYAA